MYRGIWVTIMFFSVTKSDNFDHNRPKNRQFPSSFGSAGTPSLMMGVGMKTDINHYVEDRYF